MRRGCVLLLSVALGGCGGSAKTTNSNTTSSTRSDNPAPVTLAKGFVLTSPAFKQNGRIPRRYTCDGSGAAIPLHFSGVPKSARELVLIVRDPDAPDQPFIHWALAGINPRGQSLTGVAGQNSTGKTGYVPPCPPAGKLHHYVITLSALSGPSGLKPGFTPDQIRAPAVGIATLVGTYTRR